MDSRKTKLVKQILNKKSLWNYCGYKPTPQQLAVHNSTKRFRINCQGRRSGKSYGAAYEILPWLLTPNTRGWIVAPSYDLGQKVARIVKEEVINNLRLPVANKKEVNGDLYYLKLAGLNSELSVKSADSPDSLIGEGIDYLVIDEAAAIKKSIWEQYLRPTLSDRNGWVLMISTPRGFNFFEKLYRYGQDPLYPEYDSWQHSSVESPYFKDNVEELKRTLTRETLHQEYYSEFTSFSGKVYPFDRTTQVRKLRYKPHLPTYVGLDFGFRQPAAVVCQFDYSKSQEFPDILQIDEIAMEENMKTEEFARRVRAFPYKINGYFGDPAGGGVNAQSGISDIMIFKRKGMHVKYRRDSMTRNVVNGVSHVRRWFEDANGDSHFFVDAKCKGSIQSYSNYRYPERKEDQRVKEEPLKDGRFDHICDALRYLCINLFPIKSRQIRVETW